jgi:DNA-binding response OmpR family regulator
MNPKDQTQVTILVVDADDPTRESISAILKGGGYALQSVSPGTDGSASARDPEPSLILMDGDGLDGNLKQISQRLNAVSVPAIIPVILMISECSSPVIDAANQSGVVDFVRKPLDPLELRWRIDKSMRPDQSPASQSEAQNLRNILQTAADVCHTLNQPLQYVMGTVQFLLMDMPPEDKLFDRLDMIRQKAELMGETTRKLTALTRQGAKKDL